MKEYRDLPKIEARQNKGSEVWFAEWWETVTEPGGEKRRAHKSVTLGDCRKITKKKAKDRLEEILRPKGQTSTTWTIRRFVEDVWLPAGKSRWEYNTEKSITACIRTHILKAFGDMPITDIRKLHIQAWLTGMANAGYKKSTGQLAFGQLKSILEDAIDNEIIDRNPARKLKLPKMGDMSRTVPYTMEETQILVGLPAPWGTILRVMLFCGLRPGEALALRRDDIIEIDNRKTLLRVDQSTFKSGQFKKTKNRKTRFVPVPKILSAELRSMAEAIPSKAGLLFQREHDISWTVETLLERVREMLVPPGSTDPLVKGFDLRRCRATCGTHIEADIADVRDMLGHSDISITLAHYRSPVMDRLSASVSNWERRVMGGEDEKVVEMPLRAAAGGAGCE